MIHAYRLISACRTGGAATRPAPSWGTHHPARPDWICRACSAPWPCTIAQNRLLAAYRSRRRALGILLAILRDQAVLDLPHADPKQIGARFTGWYRRSFRQAGPAFTVISATTGRDGDGSGLLVRRVRRRIDPWAVAQLDVLFAMIVPETPREPRETHTPAGAAGDPADPLHGPLGTA
jgi:hypothetical protein